MNWYFEGPEWRQFFNNLKTSLGTPAQTYDPYKTIFPNIELSLY